MIINKDNDGMYFVIIVQRFQQDPIITFVKKKIITHTKWSKELHVW